MTLNQLKAEIVARLSGKGDPDNQFTHYQLNKALQIILTIEEEHVKRGHVR